MTSGCQCPYQVEAVNACVSVSQEAVQAALERMICLSPQAPSPLVQLSLVQQALADPDLPCTPHLAEFALNLVLTTVIRDKLDEQRGVLGLETLPSSLSQLTALKAVSSDAQLGSVELLGWDWLYYRYVRVDLNISPSLFSQAAAIDPRTLRRYQRHATTRLTLWLVALERAARRERRQRATT